MIRFICLLLLTSFAFAEEEIYTVEDIEGFAAKKEWNEAMLRMPEIPAAGRGKNWDTLVEKVAIGYVRSIAEVSPNNVLGELEKLPQTYPSLQRSKKFKDTAEGSAYAGFKSCFVQVESHPECSKNLLSYVDRHPTSDRAASRFCKDAVMKKALHGWCEPNAKGERSKP